MNYTSVEQSEVLKGLLSEDTADLEWIREQWYDEEKNKYVEDWSILPVFKEDEDNNILEKIDVLITMPCWSVGALMNYLKSIDFFPDIQITGDNRVSMQICYYEDDSSMILQSIKDITVKANTFIDALYELILEMKDEELI